MGQALLPWNKGDCEGAPHREFGSMQHVAALQRGRLGVWHYLCVVLRTGVLVLLLIRKPEC